MSYFTSRLWRCSAGRDALTFPLGWRSQVLWFFLGTLLSGPLAAQLTCERTGNQVGLDRGYPVRAALAAVPQGEVTGREVVRYFVRLNSDCLLSQGMHWVDALAVRLNNEVMSSGSCRPTALGRSARVLFGLVPAADEFDTRELEARAIGLPKPAVWTVPVPVTHREIKAKRSWWRDPFTRKPKSTGKIHIDVDQGQHVEGRAPFTERSTEQQGGWAHLPLGRRLEVLEGQDVVLGLEVTQEPWECPLLVSGPFEASEDRRGSYLQLVRYEFLRDGESEWKFLDCTGTDAADADEGVAFPVDDVEARSRCGLRFPHAAFQWNMRAIATP